ncbi:MAG: mechanosensitive ion channel family protein [Bacteroidetes bacterium]|nr:mechanosensitive ion channel family protein [Bacteroidota bacterium]
MILLVFKIHILLLTLFSNSRIYQNTLRYIRQAYYSFLETMNQVFSDRNIAQFIKGLVIAILIWTVAKILLIIIRFAVKRWMIKEGMANESHKTKRVTTIGTVILNLSRYAIIIFALILTLKGFNVNLADLLVGAGVVGLVVGFGAQTLVRDVIAGFFLLFEGDLAVGDEIVFNDQVGMVEYVGVRVTKVRQFNGELRIIPNGELSNFGNLNRHYMKAIVNINLSYGQDLEKTMLLVNSLAVAFHASKPDLMLDDPILQGITQFGHSGVEIRIVFKVKPGAQYELEREFRMILKKNFDETGIEFPYNHQVVLVKNLPGS